jgi:hypothetical protein
LFAVAGIIVLVILRGAGSNTFLEVTRMKAISRTFALALGLELAAFAGHSDAASPEFA